jgi:hypothetical protein
MKTITLHTWGAGAGSSMPKARHDAGCRQVLNGHRPASFSISFAGAAQLSPWRLSNDRQEKRTPSGGENDAPRFGTTTGGATFGRWTTREVTASEKRSPNLTLKQTGS